MTLRRLVAATLIVSITGMGLPLPVHAGMLPTQSALAGASAAHERLANLLERRDVRAQLASRLDQLPAGGDGVGAVVGALLLVFIILLITDILGFTHVFPFTKPIKR